MIRLLLLLRLPSRLRRRARRNRVIILLLLLLLLLLVPLLILALVFYRPPHPVIRWLARRFPDVLWHVPLPADRKFVALTIDDAPSSHTPEILSVLAEHGAHATFFVIGSQAEEDGREALLANAVLAGHELGNHAMYDEASVALSDDRLRSDMEHVHDIIYRVYRDQDMLPPTNYFRPGGGLFTDRMRRLVDRLGYRLVLGSVYPHDPQVPWPRFNARFVLSKARPGSIIICHDRRSWTATMLRIVLPELKRRGYEVVTVSRLLEEGENAGKGVDVVV